MLFAHFLVVKLWYSLISVSRHIAFFSKWFLVLIDACWMYDTGASGERTWYSMWLLQSWHGDVAVCFVKKQPMSVGAPG